MALSAIAKRALDEHIPLLRDGVLAARYGWQVDMDWDSGICHVTLSCRNPSGSNQVDRYMLRLTFDYYPIDQPGVVFVNPETRESGSQGDFERWWPNIDGNPWINIQINQANPEKSYLCFQWTQEFKQTHSPVPDGDPKKWAPEKHTLVGVVNIIQKALDSSHYKGYRKQ